MKRNVMFLNCSPHGEKGNSYAIAAYFKQRMDSFGCESVFLSLAKEQKYSQNLFSAMSLSDVLVLSVPVYENMIPGMLMLFFEEAYSAREQFGGKVHQVFVISNSGFAEVRANESTISICRAFSEGMNFEWLGGMAVAPGTLINNGDLTASGKTYRRLIEAIDIVSRSIALEQPIPEQAFQMVSKVFIPKYIYRIAGYFLQTKTKRQIGKMRYYAKPLMN